MANHSREGCLAIDQLQLERVNYFSGQLLTQADMTADQEYFRQKLRRHNRYLHGWGVVCGLEVTPGEQPMCVVIEPGYALGPYGDEIYVPKPVCLDLASCGEKAVTDPCEPDRIGGEPPATSREMVYVAIRYAECLADPRRNMVAGCGCDEVCEYSRVRDSFEIGCLDQLPPSHEPGELALLCDFLNNSGIVPCLPCPEDPWVVLAVVSLPAEGGEISEGSIDNMYRRPILSTAVLQEQLIACCCGNVISMPDLTPVLGENHGCLLDEQSRLVIEIANVGGAESPESNAWVTFEVPSDDGGTEHTPPYGWNVPPLPSGESHEEYVRIPSNCYIHSASGSADICNFTISVNGGRTGTHAFEEETYENNTAQGRCTRERELPNLTPVLGENHGCLLDEQSRLVIEIANVGAAESPESNAWVTFEVPSDDGGTEHTPPSGWNVPPLPSGESHEEYVRIPSNCYIHSASGSAGICNFTISVNGGRTGTHAFEEETYENNTVEGSCYSPG